MSRRDEHFGQIFNEGAIERIIEALDTASCTAGERQEVPTYQTLKSGSIRLLLLVNDPARPQIPQVWTHEFTDHLRYNDNPNPSALVSHNYTAVSYTWLDEEYSWYGERLPPSTKLRIDGKVVAIPPHVAFILSCLFAPGKRWVWIDYICINRNDREERGHQVGCMDKIFRNAAAVVVFLGEPTTDTHDILKELCKLLDRVGENYKISDRKIPDLKHTRGLQQISEHEYWSRAWILQEIALASKLELICGRFVLTHYQTTEVLVRLLDINIPYPGKTHLLLINKVVSKIHQPFLNIVIDARHARCSEPRDALYAKMHLARASDGALVLKADYSKSTREVFRQFAVGCIANLRSLRILSFASGHNNCLDMPSWVPDWTPRDSMPELHLVSSWTGALLQVHRREYTARFEEGDSILIVRGWILKKMRPFRPYRAITKRDELLGVDSTIPPKTTFANDELFLCLIFGCTSILVLARRAHNYVIIDVASSGALLRWAQEELDEVAQDQELRSIDYSTTEFRIA